MARTIALALLHRGQVKQHNEDNLFLLNAWAPPGERDAYERSTVTESPVQLFAVADGMGGPDIGDLAAETALAILEQHRKQFESRMGSDFVAFARNYVEHANRVISRLLERYQGLRVGTTLAALIIAGDTAYTLSIGNSRIYLYRDGALHLLTQDHVEQQEDRRRLTHYLGMADSDALHGSENLTRTVIRRGDQFLLATDGLTHSIAVGELAELMATPTAFVQQIRRLQTQALEAGAADNLALVGIRILDPDGTDSPGDRSGRRQRSTRSGRQTPAVQQSHRLQHDLQEHRWLRLLFYFLFFVLMGLLIGKIVFSLPTWLVTLLQGRG